MRNKNHVAINEWNVHFWQLNHLKDKAALFAPSEFTAGPSAMRGHKRGDLFLRSERIAMPFQAAISIKSRATIINR